MNLLPNGNHWYRQAFEVDHARRYVFIETLEAFKGKPISILEIGCSGDIADPNAIYGCGNSSVYYAEYIRKFGGELTIVDVDSVRLDNCKVILKDFIDNNVKINLVLGDGLDWAKKPGYDYIYLDAGPEEWKTYEMFKSIDLTKCCVLLDDANEGHGNKCHRVRTYHPEGIVLKCGTSHEMLFYPRLKSWGNNTFKIGSLEIPYYRGWHGNREAMNERAPEIGLGNYFLDKFEDVIEVGAVMPYYGRTKHIVFDPYDNHPICNKVDVFNGDYNQRNVLSISTLEHVRFDGGYEKDKDVNASFEAIQKIIKESKNYLITVPMWAHTTLLEQIYKSDLKYKILRRDDKRGFVNNWSEVTNTEENMFEVYGYYEYGLDFYGNSICICVLSNLKEILS